VPDVYPGDAAARIRQLEKDVEELKALLRQRPATTSASLGWRMANMSIPSVGPGEIQIGSNDGELYVQTESGTKRLPSLPGAAPDYPGSFSSPATVSGTVQDTHYNLLRSDVVNQLFNPLRDLIEKGRVTGGSGLWNP
jgi:hypothetical protein